MNLSKILIIVTFLSVLTSAQAASYFDVQILPKGVTRYGSAYSSYPEVAGKIVIWTEEFAWKNGDVANGLLLNPLAEGHSSQSCVAVSKVADAAGKKMRIQLAGYVSSSSVAMASKVLAAPFVGAAIVCTIVE